MNAERDGSREHHPRHRIHTLFWASLLIWAGIVFTLDSSGHLPQLGHAGAWSWVFFGAGVLVLVAALWQNFSPADKRPGIGGYISGGILIIIGLSGFIAIKITWPLVLLAAGVILLGNALVRRR
jgi:hypothetical protein